MHSNRTGKVRAEEFPTCRPTFRGIVSQTVISRVFIFGLCAASLVQSGLALPVPSGATEMHGIAAPGVSPDGKLMVFEWIDDLWTAPTSGGEALRIVNDPGRDAYPLFTPDGTRIVFSSDRTGSMQLYSIPAGGGEAVRHTWNTEGNQLECISPDGKRAIVGGIRDRAGFRNTRMEIIDLDKPSREQRLFDATGDSAAWSPDGTRILFCRRGEQLYRKGYKGSRASQIWEYEISSGKFSCRVSDETEARSPFWHADGKGFHFVSSRNGTLNLWTNRDDKTPPEQVTELTGDGMILRAPSSDHSVFVFHRGAELYKIAASQQATPVPLTLWTKEKLPDVSQDEKEISTTTDADFSKDLGTAVFASLGELWMIKGPNGKTQRLTDNHASESEPRFSPDGEWLYFLRDDGLAPNYFRARLVAGILEDERQITKGLWSKSRLSPSPDGSKIAWIEGTGDVFTAMADGSEVKRIYRCWNMPTFDWSPDGQWLAIAAEDANANRDIWLASATGSRKPSNLTRHPAFDGSPRWSPDGRQLVFSSRRGADGKSRLLRIDFGKEGVPADAKISRLHSQADKARPLPTGEMEPTRVIWATDSRYILFQNKKASDKKLYSLDIRSKVITSLTEQRGVPIRISGKDTLAWRVNKQPAILRGSELTIFPISTSITRSREEMNQLAFRRVWRALGERFYDPEMNHNDWDALRSKYEVPAKTSRTSRQFDRVVSQLFGELNASHLTFLRKPWSQESVKPKHEAKTGHPGLVFRSNDPAGPLVIDRVIKGSPVAFIANAPKAGETLVKIAGQAVTNRSPLGKFFEGAESRSIPITLRNKEGKERVIELRCISYAQARSLDRKEQDSLSRKAVAKAGKFAYLRIPDMNKDTIMEVELQIYRASLKSEGIILDLRNNGGGREADRLLAMFCQPRHSFTKPRGGPIGYPTARRVISAWDKSLVVLCNENTFSNAEIFCHSIKETKRAPLVGNPTAGGVISAVKQTIPDAGELQVPFRGWFSTRTGKNLDLNGAQPDVPVDLAPEDENSGRDPQLEKAIQLLLEQKPPDK